jgi:type IX secretion system PorP/SprF family membrane protein
VLNPRRIIFLSLFSLLACIIVKGQDPQFTQFYANPLYTNPAFTGAANNFRFVAAGRNQYTALQNNYKTVSASFDVNSSALKGGIGLMASNDVSGDGFLTSNTFSALYSYQINVNRYVTIRAGIQASFIQKSYDFNKFRFGDQIDDRYGFIYPTKEISGLQNVRIPNFATGFLVYTQTFFAGVAIHNLAEPNQSFYYPNSSDQQFRLPRRYTGHAGVNIYLTNQRDEQQRTILSPNILYMSQRNFNQLNVGFYIKRQALTAGAWYRQTTNNSDAAILLIGLKFPKFRIGYSYDITISNARSATQGSHELTAAFEITKKKREKRVFKQLTCPDF